MIFLLELIDFSRKLTIFPLETLEFQFIWGKITQIFWLPFFLPKKCWEIDILSWVWVFSWVLAPLSFFRVRTIKACLRYLCCWFGKYRDSRTPSGLLPSQAYRSQKTFITSGSSLDYVSNQDFWLKKANSRMWSGVQTLVTPHIKASGFQRTGSPPPSGPSQLSPEPTSFPDHASSPDSLPPDGRFLVSWVITHY